MDIQTSHRLLHLDLHREAPGDLNRGMMALMNAMDHYKSRRFWFNEGTTLQSMVTGVQSYNTSGARGLVLDSLLPLSTTDYPQAIPPEMLRPINIQVQVGEHWHGPMCQVGIERIREWTHWEGALGTYPSDFAYFNQSLHFHPIPGSDHTYRIDYVKDVNRPRYNWTGTKWQFQQQDFYDIGDTLPDESTASAEQWAWKTLELSYTNEWLEYAEPMIRAWAMWDMYANFYNDEENARASMAVMLYEEERVRGESSGYQDGSLRTEVPPL